MKFSIASLFVAAIMAAPALACQCTKDSSKTESCCNSLSGTYKDGDCQASSISEHLSNFRSCCGGYSDCDFPSKREDEDETIVV
ncbi:hypothetical protein ASPWEDRAFT_39837 [Aspergillus wentii DTO 134E9]|uniref:Extracellular membrane protein CFEM domain-containing protein n=1 Tax=Aspergillus wentii DTO 134E9 TaxID=1073089 RepID=A0A1L9RIJ9_ASPWE|nr:uncharacterized protein ASPWEDRAFT_39837 [Aspergillus wentii DTO 134E9]OJJ34756.1 hypothetical protein ASPWEDRAFT_39837 [Aspergillus wentii DTO 134E9]